MILRRRAALTKRLGPTTKKVECGYTHPGSHSGKQTSQLNQSLRRCSDCLEKYPDVIRECVGFNGAASDAGGVQAMCLAEGPRSGKYTVALQTCTAWKSGHYGAVDDPPDYGKENQRLYSEEEAA